jgi:hypothetical protein
VTKSKAAAELAGKRTRTPKVCPGCDQAFMALRVQTCCSGRCRTRLHRWTTRPAS